MIYLILSILSAICLFVVFKFAEKYKSNTFNIILINYVVASSLGFILYKEPIKFSDIYSQPWFILSIFIGVLFIVMFFVIAKSTQKVGISITTIASKMSVIIPILFSIIYFNEEVTLFKVVGIIMALIAVFLTIYKKKNNDFQIYKIVLPIILFFGMGMVDSVVKYSQQTYQLSDDASSLFSATLFAFAGITGLFFSLFNLKSYKDYKRIDTLILGLILGIANFGTIYFLINALDSNIFDSSIIFGINNIGIVGGSVLTGVFLFKEKISILNYIGIAISVVAIILLSYS